MSTFSEIREMEIEHCRSRARMLPPGHYLIDEYVCLAREMSEAGDDEALMIEQSLVLEGLDEASHPVLRERLLGKVS